MKRIALAPLLLVAVTFAPAAAADHGHNCVWSGGAWMGQGLCPGMPGFVPHTDPPAPEPELTPEPTTTIPAPPAPAPAPAPVPTPSPPPPPATTPPPPAPAPTRTPGCLRSYGNTWCTGQATPAAAPAVAAAAAPVAEPEPLNPAEHWIWQYVY